MEEKFHKRFNIDVDFDEAKKRFVNRVQNQIFESLVVDTCSHHYTVGPTVLRDIKVSICSALGTRYFKEQTISGAVGNDFLFNLQAIEAMYQYGLTREGIREIVPKILEQSEVDLGIRWHEGKFLPIGSPLLDEKLVNDVLGLLSQDNLETVSVPFNKGLDHLLKSTNKPELLTDVITNMHEALEAMAKIVAGNTRELSKTQELFISKLNLSEYFKKLLKDYIKYANDLARHAANPGEGKQIPEYKEVESFVYMTGLFIRLGLQ